MGSGCQVPCGQGTRHNAPLCLAVCSPSWPGRPECGFPQSFFTISFPLDLVITVHGWQAREDPGGQAWHQRLSRRGAPGPPVTSLRGRGCITCPPTGPWTHPPSRGRACLLSRLSCWGSGPHQPRTSLESTECGVWGQGGPPCSAPDEE